MALINISSNGTIECALTKSNLLLLWQNEHEHFTSKTV